MLQNNLSSYSKR